MDQDSTQRFYTISEVADLLQVSVYTVRRWIREGSFPVTELSPRTRRVSQQQLNDYLSGRTLNDDDKEATDE